MSDPTTTDADSFEARVFPFGRSEADSMAGYPKPTTTDAPRDLLALVRAAIAECELRLTVCEAQTPGPWRQRVLARHLSSPPDSNGPRLTVACSMDEADLLAICYQRTERPQELRAIIGTLRYIETFAGYPMFWDVRMLMLRTLAMATVDGIVRELGVRP